MSTKPYETEWSPEMLAAAAATRKMLKEADDRRRARECRLRHPVDPYIEAMVQAFVDAPWSEPECTTKSIDDLKFPLVDVPKVNRD